MRYVMLLLATLAVGCQGASGSGNDAASFDGQEIDGDMPNVVIIGWDGVQWDHLQQCRAGELEGCPDGLPNLEAISGGRVFESITTTAATKTKPGWVEILTGYDARRFGILDNHVYDAVPAGYSLFERIEDHFGDEVQTIFIAGKTRHIGGKCYTDSKEPWCKVKIRLDYYEDRLADNANVAQMAKMLLKAHADEPMVFFMNFWDPDHTGHRHGESSARYSKRLATCDRWLGKLVAYLDKLGILDRTLIYVVSDHGFDEDGDVHDNAPFAFLASNDPLVIRGGDRKDLTPTILKRLGVPLDPAGEIPAVDGQPLDVVPTACVEEGGARLDYDGAPDCCPGLTRVGLIKDDQPKAWVPLCLNPTGRVGDQSGHCTSCGDGECVDPENRCNCPQDCY